jgi:predicted nucleic-acid-binding Zn-ribbon protein
MSDEAWRGEPEPGPARFFSSIFGMREATPEEQAAFAQRLAERRAKGRLLASTIGPYRPDARCPKCGHGKTRTAYCRGTGAGECVDAVGDTEHLHRECKRCLYAWYERTLDAEHGT